MQKASLFAGLALAAVMLFATSNASASGTLGEYYDTADRVPQEFRTGGTTYARWGYVKFTTTTAVPLRQVVIWLNQTNAATQTWSWAIEANPDATCSVANDKSGSTVMNAYQYPTNQWNPIVFDTQTDVLGVPTGYALSANTTYCFQWSLSASPNGVYGAYIARGSTDVANMASGYWKADGGGHIALSGSEWQISLVGDWANRLIFSNVPTLAIDLGSMGSDAVIASNSSSFSLTGAGGFCDGLAGNIASTTFAYGIPNRLAFMSCYLGAFMVVPSDYAINKFQTSAYGVRTHVPWSYLTEFQDAWTATNSQDFPTIAIPIDVFGASASLDVISSASFTKWVPSSTLSFLRGISTMGLWFAFGWYAWNRGRKIFNQL